MDYIIQPGDTLYSTAARFGIPVSQLLAANPQISNPNLIFAGHRITIPLINPLPKTAIYTVRAGDTLYLIATNFGTTLAVLLQLNPGLNPNLIYPGQTIRVPAEATPEPPGCIVFVSNRSGMPELWRSDAAGSGVVQITRKSGTMEQPTSNPQWSPNGRYIAYQAVGGLFIIDPCGRRPIRLAPSVTNYTWSHDGTRIAFSNPDGTSIVDLNGNIRKVSTNLFNPVWFPGDIQLAGYTIVEGVNNGVLATVNVSGTNFKAIEPVVPATRVKISPDSRYAATFLFQGAPSEIFAGVWIYEFATGKLLLLPGHEFKATPKQTRNISFLGGWSPDSKQLVYSTMLDVSGHGEIRAVSPQGQIMQTFPRSFYPQTDWGVAEDWIIYIASGQPGTVSYASTTPRQIFVLNPRTGREVKIASAGDNYSPDWNNTDCPPCT